VRRSRKSIKVFLECSADDGIREDDGDTALSFAEKIGHAAVVELLEKAK
jgi:ankyrin repeat protein